MKTSDFDYDLPPALIAQHPPAERGQSRLLHLPGGVAPLEHCQVTTLPRLLRAGDLLVFNDTRVIPARVFG
ncbi:MAG: S-adenosylmethionine:tRNA ribosyltransferase-isomerase, partial [Pseudomonadales bacterium]